jgi:hypothetical protein
MIKVNTIAIGEGTSLRSAQEGNWHGRKQRSRQHATGYEAGPEDDNGPDTVAKIQRVYIGQEKAISGSNELPFLAIFTRKQMVRFREEFRTP